jgi:hypothetical protein
MRSRAARSRLSNKLNRECAPIVADEVIESRALVPAVPAPRQVTRERVPVVTRFAPFGPVPNGSGDFSSK